MYKKIIGLLVALMVMVVIPKAVFAEPAPASNLDNARALYGVVDDSKIVTYGVDVSSVQAALDVASYKATDISPAIAYIPSGYFPINPNFQHVYSTWKGVTKWGTMGIYVPRNVILVAESDTVFSCDLGANGYRMVYLDGSIYGGQYLVNGRALDAIQYINETEYPTTVADGTTKQVNGNVEYTYISGLPAKGVAINAVTCKNININYNVITDSYAWNATGINLIYSSTAGSISYNNISNLGLVDSTNEADAFGSAISLSHSDASRIMGNTITRVAGHGISTDTEQTKWTSIKDTCVVDYINSNKISECNKHGIWLEDGCQIVKGMTGNTITKCKQNGIAISAKRAYGPESNNIYSIYYMKNNKITYCKASNVSMVGRYAKVRMIDGNNITNSSGNAITLDQKAYLYILGKNNKINNNAQYAVYLKNGSTLNVKKESSGTQMIKNKKYSIGLNKKSKALVCNTNMTGNVKGTAYVGIGSTFTYNKNCKVEKIVNGTTD